jgi:hypothetical protein
VDAFMDKKLKTSLELEVKALRARVEKLEALLVESLVRPKEVPAPVVEKKPEIAPEIILAISAAVAAFLGKRKNSSDSFDGLVVRPDR